MVRSSDISSLAVELAIGQARPHIEVKFTLPIASSLFFLSLYGTKI